MFRMPASLALCLSLTLAAQKPSLADSVNPLVGTANEGNTYPGVGVPFGMTMWTPATRSTELKGIIPYYYNDPRIAGFRGSHFLSGSAVQDYGSFQLMAGSGAFPANAADRSAMLAHAEEHAKPYRYDIALKDLKVHVSLTGTRA